MNSLTSENRIVYITYDPTGQKINEARFKLAGLGYGYGRMASQYYWSFPEETREIGLDTLQHIFGEVHFVR